jgi:hypothetical protein
VRSRGWSGQPGLHRVRGGPAAAIERARRHSPRVHRLAAPSTRDGLLAGVARALGFPGWFGHNWDALADSLTDLSWLPPGPVVLVWEHPSALRRADPAAYRTALGVLRDATAASVGGGHPLTVLLADS